MASGQTQAIPPVTRVSVTISVTTPDTATPPMRCRSLRPSPAVPQRLDNPPEVRPSRDRAQLRERTRLLGQFNEGAFVELDGTSKPFAQKSVPAEGMTDHSCFSSASTRAAGRAAQRRSAHLTSPQEHSVCGQAGDVHLLAVVDES